MAQPEYYQNGKRMKPTKLMFSIKEKVENQIKESHGAKPRDVEQQGGVSNQANYQRFTENYLQNSRDYSAPIKEINETAFVQNIRLISRMLNQHE